MQHQNQTVCQRAQDQCQSAAMTPPVGLNFSFPDILFTFCCSVTITIVVSNIAIFRPVHNLTPLQCPSHLRFFIDLIRISNNDTVTSILSHFLPSCSFVCTAGSYTPTPIDNVQGYPCPAGFYCPTGSAVPLGCPIGTYNDKLAQSNCSECLEGLMCHETNMTTPVPCKEGEFTPRQKQNPCTVLDTWQ